MEGAYEEQRGLELVGLLVRGPPSIVLVVGLLVPLQYEQLAGI